MKKHYFSLSVFLVLSVLGFSQGIEFEHGSWKEVLDKAQQTNKPVFVDVFTTWCGPCKMMSKDIFPLEEVGKVYNAGFVCYKLDAEKGEGPEIAKKYEVKAYPTYLFLKPDGTLFYRALGSMDAQAFIGKAQTALSELKDTKSIDVWNKEYPQKKNDPAFLLGYMQKRAALELSNSDIFNEYLELLPENERVSASVAGLYKKEATGLKINTFAFTNLQKNADKFGEALPANLAHKILFSAIINSLNEAARNRNEEMLKNAMTAYDALPQEVASMKKDELYMQYYEKVRNMGEYIKYAGSFANTHLMKITNKEIEEKDRANLAMIEEKLKSGALANVEPDRLAELKNYVSNMERNRISQSLNNIAWNAFLEISDKKILKEALKWSARSLELTPNNPGWLDTYANLLYKLGKKKQAIAKEEEALRNVNSKENQVYKKGIEETLQKMKTGAKTWKH